MNLKPVFSFRSKAVFGMIHLGPLPGSPRYGGSMSAVLDRALKDGEALLAAGVDALIVENFNDDPFFTMTVAPETVAAMTLASKTVAEETKLPLGINVMRNSWQAAMGIAAIVGAKFIRINVLTDVMVTDQGIIEGCSAQLLRYRKMLNAENVMIFADIEAKHASPLVARPRSVVAGDMIERGGAEGIIVSGLTSADPPDPDHLKELRGVVDQTPLIIGSGMSIKTVGLLKLADATVFGFGAKPNLKAPVDKDMAMKFMDAVRDLRENKA